MTITLIAALSENQVIGRDGGIPWHLKKDFAWFQKNTLGHSIVMGRKNYEDIIGYSKNKPLKDRTNIILTRQQNFTPVHADFVVKKEIGEILKLAEHEEVMIIGGEQIYAQFMPYANRLILTEIHKTVEGNTFFPQWNKGLFQETFRQAEEENGFSYDFVIYEKI